MSQRQFKDPSEVLEFTQDWSDQLGVDTIITSTWAVTDGITIDSDTETTAAATVWLSGGTAGHVYRATNTIVTAAGRTLERTLRIRVYPL